MKKTQHFTLQMNNFFTYTHSSRSFSAEVKPAYDTTELENREHNANLLRLITAYRRYGHILADLDPLGLEKKRYKSTHFLYIFNFKSPPPELDLSRYGLNKIPKDKQFPLPGLIKIGTFLQLENLTVT